ncbi:MAG: hypothetical protein JO062_22630 [Bryobacterales bacterium]|nr:hypothetical protein [Bryobacterales bacterium]
MLKFCALFSLCAAVSLSQSFVTGQGARLVVGQSNFTAQTPGASDTLLGSAAGLAFAGDTLFVADSNRIGYTPNNNRVLLFKNVSQKMPLPLNPIPAYSGRCPVCVGQASTVIGQPDFVSTNFQTSQTGMRSPTAIASDGRLLAVADTENNRILIYNTIPTQNGQPADIVLGQPDFNTVQPIAATASSFRGPQGVWIQNGKVFVADTQNNRILIWNSIPTKNNQPADVVLGQKDFNSVIPIPVAQSALTPVANTMLNPVSVTSDGIRLFVADLGYDRVLIWNSIPTHSNTAADVELGQKDFFSATPNDISNLCPQAGTDSNGNPTYPARCGRTMDTPRFALSNGQQLFVADGGNDRILVYNKIPTQSATEADQVLGQPDEFASVVTSMTDIFHPLLLQSAANVIPSPTSLAWDGTNLYAADPSNRRILVFTPGQVQFPIAGIRNAASREVFATGGVDISGTIQAGDTVTITISGTNYVYKILSTDTVATVVQALVNLINEGAGDPNVLADVQSNFSQVQVIARQGGPGGNAISLAASTSTNARITATTSGGTLSGGESAGTIAPGTIVSFFGYQLADTTVVADTSQQLPLDLGGVQVYFDGIRAPIFFVSPGQVNAQMPFEVSDSNSASAYIRTVHSDGSVTVTNAVGVPIALQNPGIFAVEGQDPRQALAYHGSSQATGTITISGTIQANDVGTITIEDRSYSYTVQATDTLNTVRDALIALINANPGEKVYALAGGAYVRILLRAKVEGPEGNNIPLAASSTNSNSGTSPQLSLGLSNVVTCCANRAGAPITIDNPAQPGETLYVYATGLGLVNDVNGNNISVLDGVPFNGPQPNNANSAVSSLVDTKTANVISAGLSPGGIGVYQVVLELNPDIPPNNVAQVTISQDIYTSNIVTIPVGNTSVPPSQ